MIISKKILFYSLICNLLCIKSSEALLCSNVMRNNVENCDALVCIDKLADDFIVQRELIGKNGESCKYRESYQKYNFAIECSLTNYDIKGILADFPQYSGPWLMDYENSCKPIFAPLIFKEDQKNELIQKAIQHNISAIYTNNDWTELQEKRLNFFSLAREVREKRNFLYSYSANDFVMRDLVNKNIEKRLSELELFISKILANRQSRMIEDYSRAISDHISFIKYLFKAIITLNSVIHINDRYNINLNNKNLNFTNRDYDDFIVKAFDRDFVNIEWNARYFDRIFSLYKNDFIYMDDNTMKNKKYGEKIIINLQNQTIYINLQANQTFDPMQMRIINGMPNYKIVRKKFNIEDFIKEGDKKNENIEYKNKIDFLTTLSKEIDFDIYDLDNKKSFIEDIVVKKLFNN